jgi:hypothetical protein
MDLGVRLSLLAGLIFLTFLINLPFGYLRGKTRKLTLKWFMYVHLPIPIVFLMRTFAHLEVRYIPVFVAAAVMGQLLGGRLEP